MTTEPHTATTAALREHRIRRTNTLYGSSIGVWLLKIVCLGLLDAASVYAVMALAAHAHWITLAVVALAAVLLNVIYLVPNRFLPGKYLAPGLVFLLLYSVLSIFYTAYVSTTNQSDGHIIGKSDAVAAIMADNQERVQGSAVYPSAVAIKNGDMWLVVVDPRTKKVEVGNNTHPLAAVDGARLDSQGDPAEVPGYTMLDFAQLSQQSAQVSKLQAALDADPNQGYLRTATGSMAYLYRPTMHYDAAAGTMTDSHGTVYRDTGHGAFTSDTGQSLMPGWRINVGAKNFTSVFTDPEVRAPLLRIIIWTIAFAVISVASTFALGLVLALVFNDPRLKGQKIYRTLMILPYTFPGFLSGLVWMGLLNRKFGFVNQVLLHGADIPWLTDPAWARISVIMVNLWLGFPYMFLVSTGALQSIPGDILEAARIDGASPWQVFRHVKFPMLMVPLAPLLISSFAFNFNNFQVIFMLTGGGPRFQDTSMNVGSTDILITMVYKLSGFAGGGAHQYGLASALSIIIFIIVGAVAYLGFRQTRTLEELN